MVAYTSKCCHFNLTHYSFTTKGSLTLEKKMTAIINGHLTSQMLCVLSPITLNRPPLHNGSYDKSQSLI